ncbi:MAG: hypothetical protein QG626_754 [Patescibacteria group bacterium]|nr:hypothetical protein [Patescibacteria group bacterium]
MQVGDSMNTRGFTVVELMLSVAVIALMAGISMPIYRTFQTRNEADIAAQMIAQALRIAEMQALLGRSGSGWGVYIETDAVTVFKGASYTERDTDFDNMQVLPGSVEISGDQEFIFPLGEVAPEAVGEVVITSMDQHTRSLVVNALGMVEY